MHDSYALHIRLAYPEATLVERPSFRPSYPLAYGDTKRTRKTYWHYGGFDLIHETHDGKHTFISVLEVAVNADEVRLPVKSLHGDLHRLYLLNGNVTLRPSGGASSPLALQANQYALLYAPPQQSGHIVFGKGRHLLAGIAMERSWQKREPIKGFQRPRTCKASPPHVLDPLTRMTVTGLLSLPAKEGLSLDHALDGFAVQLHDLHRARSTVSAAASVRLVTPAGQQRTLVDAIKQGIQQEIEAQRYPSVDKLAADLNRSRQLLHRHFRESTAQSIKAYITEQVMQEASRLLREARLPPAAVAFRLGYSEQTSFNHQFKSYYGMTPGEAREAEEIPTIQRTNSVVY